MDIPEPTSFVLAVMAGTLFGLLSIPHCLGMCGPLHLTVYLSAGARSVRTLTLFNLGRIVAYTAIGMLCGLFGGQLTRLLPEKATPVVQASAVETEGIIAAPKSCCEAAAATAANEDTTATGEAGEAVKTKSLWRRGLMYIFPAIILLLTGAKALVKKPAVAGVSSPGLFSRLFAKSRKGGPAVCGMAAGLLPCGMLYYAFAVAVSTLSPLLGAVFLFVYCVTITFFLQLSIMVGTTFGKQLGPKVERLFPWLAFAGTGVYVMLFFVR